MKHHDIPIKLSEALYLAAQIARRNEEMEAELTELRMNNQYPEVLQSHHIIELLGIGKSTLSEWAQDPTFPHIQGDWRKGMSIRVRKSEFYEWLRNRKEREIERHLNVRKFGKKAM